MSKLARGSRRSPDSRVRNSVALVIALVIALAGTTAMLVAIYHERRMHGHRQPGVTYGKATFRRDGGWRRTDLFTETGLAHQRRASRFGVAGALLWLLALIAWILLNGI